MDRSSSQNMVETVANLFDENENFSLALSPEGTRKKVDKLRTGFYFIAQKARVPIIMVGLDYHKKQVLFSEPYFTTDNQERDFEYFLSFFRPLQGKIPGKGMGHL